MEDTPLLIDEFKTSLIDSRVQSNSLYHHRLLSNKKEKIISTLRNEFENCDEFIVSVAFITESGLALLLNQLKSLEEKNIKGKILTGDYLNFTQPKALKKILSFKNIELKILSKENFHAKGYFFRKNNVWTSIIGSSNLTQKALTTNFEWNLKINSLSEGKITKEILDNFYEIYESISETKIEDIEEYEKIYNITREMMKSQHSKKILKIKPNSMQREALENLKELRKTKDKALLISATGTGKTYLSAFDVKSVNPSKILFIAHRKNILENSKFTFENIISDKKMAIYGDKDWETAEYIFAMVQTLNKEEHLKRFAKNHFDYIIIDEVHHSGAKTYQNIINYFTPKFFLGMTATPERNDEFDIYQLFDHNIAYEIRLHEALKENLLCPFHYFGISDIEIDGKVIDEKMTIKDLVLDERVDHILEKSEYYGYSGEKLHGLIFVSKVEEAQILSEKLNGRGRKAKYLSGAHSEEERNRAIDQLERGELEYLITVDIFNEGIDIPCVNQVLLLRPTDSAIVYIQQLGRGLRKNINKEYVVVLDFIGNYEKNFLIPTAISQNNSYDKDFMKRFINSGTDYIPGESSIIFEEIVKERIFETINRTNFSTRKNIEHDYRLLKKQLGRIPLLNDFFTRNMIEPSVILKYKKDYDEVLKALDPKENFQELNSLEKNFLKFLSIFFTPAKRIHEIYLFQSLLKNKSIHLTSLNREIEENYNLQSQYSNTSNAILHLSKEIFTSLSTAKEYEPIAIKLNSNEYEINSNLKLSYENNTYFRRLIDDLIEYNLNYVRKNYRQTCVCTTEKYQEYTKQEAFWYMNLDYNNGYQVSGYTIFEEEKKVMIFITLDENKIKNLYDNQFLDEQRFTWFSKNNRCMVRNGKITSEGKIAENYYTIEVFIKKKLSDNFYYLGKVDKVLKAKECRRETGEPLVEYELKLQDAIEPNLFKYLTK